MFERLKIGTKILLVTGGIVVAVILATFIVSDITGNKVSTVAPDRKTVHTLLSVESPADIGLDRQLGLLYVPMLMKNEARIYKLSCE